MPERTCHCPLQLIRVRVLGELHWAVYIIYKLSNLAIACKYTLWRATYFCVENAWSHVALSDVQVTNSVSWEKTAVAWALRATFSKPLSHWENTDRYIPRMPKIRIPWVQKCSNSAATCSSWANVFWINSTISQNAKELVSLASLPAFCTLLVQKSQSSQLRRGRESRDRPWHVPWGNWHPIWGHASYLTWPVADAQSFHPEQMAWRIPMHFLWGELLWSTQVRNPLHIVLLSKQVSCLGSGQASWWWPFRKVLNQRHIHLLSLWFSQLLLAESSASRVRWR